jgi:transposase
VQNYLLGNLSLPYNFSKGRVYHVSQLFTSTVDQIELELKKCKLLCCLCHKREHFNFEAYEKHYSDICAHSIKRYIPGRWTIVNTELLYKLAKEGKSIVEISKQIDRNQRTVRRAMRRLEKETGEELVRLERHPKLPKQKQSNIKVNDKELLDVLPKMIRKQIKKQFGISGATLARRIAKLIKTGLYEPTQPAQIAKRKLKAIDELVEA